MAGARARIFTKLVNSSTFIAQLIKNPFKSRKASWVSGTTRWLKSSSLPATSTPSEAAHAARSLVEERSFSQQCSKALTRYFEQGLFATRSYLAAACKRFSAFTRGIEGLIALRCGNVLTANRAARHGLISAEFENTCPCCMEATPETVPHILLRCRAWSVSRNMFLRPLIRSLPGIIDSDRVTALCGGTTSDGSLDAFSSSWAKGSKGSPAKFGNVVLFLDRIFSKRASLVWRHSTLSQGPNA